MGVIEQKFIYVQRARHRPSGRFLFEYIINNKNIDFYRKYIFLSRAKTNIKIKIYENFTLKARSKPHTHLFLMIFHDKNPWRYGSGFFKYIPQNKVFNKMFSQNEIECYRFKKEPSEN